MPAAPQVPSAVGSAAPVSNKETTHQSKSMGRPVWLNVVLFGAAMAAGAVVYAVLPASLAEEPRRMASIFAMALVLWVTEAIPLFATSLFVIVAQAWWLAVPPDLENPLEYTAIFGAFASPIVFLFLGGFILARGLQIVGIDSQLAILLLRPFGTRPGPILAGILLITAFFSMWMSNTATTALMVALVAPMVMTLAPDDRFRIALILGVPLAANIGGIGTPIGTPPNAIALGELRARGLEIDFFQWMLIAVPLLLLALAGIWALLMLLFPSGEKRVDFRLEADFALTRPRLLVYAIFVLTVGLWLTTPLHGVPTAVIAVVPAALLPIFRIIGRREFNSLEWDVLMLIAGGIALGDGMKATGLDTWLIAHLPLEGLPYWGLIAACTATVTLISTVMSNTVAANIIMPIALAAATALDGAPELRTIAVMVAIGASFAMALPISTPPNVIAYSSGLVPLRSLMLAGAIISIAGVVLIVVTGPAVVGWIFTLFPDTSGGMP